VITLSASHVTRWQPGQPCRFETAASSVSCGGVTVTAVHSEGYAVVEATDMASLCPSLGVHGLEWSDGTATPVERVGSRYATPRDLVAYGDASNDDFGRWTEDQMWAVIQRAEETFEASTRRSFCQRALVVRTPDSDWLELPVQDAVSVSDGELVTDRQMVPPAGGGEVTVTYGAPCDSQVTAAVLQLAAWYLRPRAAGENARGANVDGVYVSYQLATGEDGSWTGLPQVDAAIAAHASRRKLVAV
jgi:hypothetical protein